MPPNNAFRNFSGQSMLDLLLVGSNVDVVTEMVNNMTNLRYFQLNTAIIKTADEMLGTILDIKS